MTPSSATVPALQHTWADLLDRLEERLRRIETAGLTRAGSAADLGALPTSAEVPGTAPTEAERLRLHALLTGHDRLEQRLSARREQLHRARRYQLENG